MGRNTIQQDIICQTVKTMRNHPSPDEVYKEINNKYPTIGRATVYRVLNKLANKGEIKRVAIPDAADRFDFRTDEHIHIRCRCCNKVFDADFDGSKDVLNKISSILKSQDKAQLNGFINEGAHISFYGICADCQSSQQ